jgi:hypothetical protein
MFQDEARFGRMAKPKRCWAPAGLRPVMPNGYEREYTYVYGAVSPKEGEMEHLICDKMNTENMGKFLAQVSTRYPEDYVLMILDGASSHITPTGGLSKALYSNIFQAFVVKKASNLLECAFQWL